MQPDFEMYENNDQYYNTDSEDEKPLKSRCDLNSFTCTYCQKQLRTKKGLKIHQRKHTGEKLHACHVCQMKFTKRNHLVRHMQVHAKEENVQHVCDICDKTFCSIYLLEKHKSEHTEQSGEDKAEKSDETETVGDNSDGVEKENEQIKECYKSENGTYECTICKKSLSTDVGMRIHMRRHTGNNLSKCQVNTNNQKWILENL